MTVKEQAKAEKLRGPKKDRFRVMKFGVSCLSGVRTCTVKFYGGGEIKKASPCWVSCTCPWFLYYAEATLTQAGSSSIIFSNGGAAKIRNPEGKKWLCKHLYKVATDGLKAVKESGLPDVVERQLLPRGRRKADLSRPSLIKLPEELAKLMR